MELAHTLDFLVVGALALLSLGLVGLALACSQLVPQVNHLLSFVQGQHEGMHGRGRERRKAA